MLIHQSNLRIKIGLAAKELYNIITRQNVEKGDKNMEDKNMTVETIKELGRWAILFVAAWVVTETMKQLTSIPETAIVRVWVLEYQIPVRFLFGFALAGAGRIIDRWIHTNPNIKANGMLPF